MEPSNFSNLYFVGLPSPMFVNERGCEYKVNFHNQGASSVFKA